MGSSKTAQALITKYNYEEKGFKVLFLKPSTDTRDGTDIIRSRIGIESKVEILNPDTDLYWRYVSDQANIDVIIIDESQFMMPSQVEECRRIVDDFDISVMLYGLKTDFRSRLFEGSKRILELADDITEIKTVCSCGRKAIINARIIDGKPVIEGKTIDIGGNEKYTSMCHACWTKALQAKEP